MRTLMFQIMVDGFGGGLPRRTGKVASAKKLLWVPKMKLLTQPFADPPFGLAGASGHRFIRQQTGQHPDIRIAGACFENMDVVMPQHGVQLWCVECDQLGSRAGAMGPPAIIHSITPSEFEFFELIRFDSHGMAPGKVRNAMKPGYRIAGRDCSG